MHTEKKKDRAGFTLIEILVVVIILGVLAGLVVPRIIGKPGEARQAKARMQIENIETALKMFKLENGFYPTTEQGLEALIRKPSTGRIPTKYKDGGYLEKGRLPKDPWDQEYLYLSPGVHNRDFDLWSLGGDGTEGGEGEDADVTNWGQGS